MLDAAQRNGRQATGLCSQPESERCTVSGNTKCTRVCVFSGIRRRDSPLHKCGAGCFCRTALSIFPGEIKKKKNSIFFLREGTGDHRLLPFFTHLQTRRSSGLTTNVFFFLWSQFSFSEEKLITSWCVHLLHACVCVCMHV